VSSFSYFNPGINYLNKPKKTEGGTFYELEHVDQNIVPEQHNVHCLGLEGTGNNSNQWKCVYSIGVQTTSVTIGGTLLCSPSSGNFNIGISSLCDIPASPGTNQNLIWTGSAFAWCDTTSGYSSAAFDTDFGNKSTTDLSEGTNCYYTDVRAQTAITGGTGVTVVSGAVSIPQTVATTSCPTFCNLTIDGNLTVNGACTIVTSNCVNIGDSTITLNSDELGTPTENAGLEVERGTATNVGIIWNETSDVWQVTCDGSTYNNIISTPDVTSSLPSQTGNSGCYLGTDGASASWDTLTKTTVGLSNVDNTTDAGKPISTSTQSALNLKAPLASPAFTGTPTGITKTHVGLSDVDNTTDANKPVSTATQTALDDKLAITTAGTTYAPLASPALTGTATGVNLTLSGDLTVDGTTTTINSTTLSVDDKNIELGSVATPTDVTADGGGITLKGTTDKTIVWDDTNDNWTSNQDWNLPTGKVFKINNISVLSATTLQYLDATSSVQTQIDSKQASLTSGIADTNNVIVDSASVADDEYARFTASGLESRSVSEVLSDIGAQGSLTSGIADTNNVVVDSASVADDEYARFTASGLESRSTSEVLSDIGAASTTSPTFTGLITANGGIETSTTTKVKQKGAFMQSSTHQSLVLGG
jgi:hypothetical protein